MPIKQRIIDCESGPNDGGLYSRYHQLPEIATASLPAAAAGNEGAIVYDATTNTVKYSDGSSWANIGLTGSVGTADQVYNAGAWTVTGDANDVIFNLGAAYNMKLNATATGSAAVLETDNAAGTATTSILCSATAAVTTAIDASAANITNALSIGANAIVGTTGTIDFTNFDVDSSGNVSCVDLTSTGTATFAAFEVAGPLTADEFIFDTDGAAPAATVCYGVRDNSGDLTFNCVTGKTLNLAVAGSDEYAFGASAVDLNGNHLDNSGYLIMNAVTLPAGTEVYAGHDNSGDLTLNALTGKDINFAIAGTDEIRISANLLEILAGSDIQFGDDGAILDSAGNEVLAVEATGSAVNYLQVKNAATANPISLACLGTADKGFLFENDQDEIICAMTPVATGVNYIDIISAATAGAPIIKVQSEADIGLSIQNAAGEKEFEVACDGSATVNWLQVKSTDTGVPVQLVNPGEDDVGFEICAKNGEEILALAATAAGTNNIKITNNANSSYPTIEAEGSSDANVGINFVCKGTAPFVFDQQTIVGGDGANENLIFGSTSNATKGFVGILNGEEGLKVGGTADRATDVGDNAVHIFDGATAPSGTLANGVTFYSEGGEAKVLDAAGNSTTLSPHTPDGDIVIHHYSPIKDETTTIHIEKLAKALADAGYSEFIEIFKGHKHLINE